MNETLVKLYDHLPPPMRSLAASLRGLYLRSWRYGPETERLVEEALGRESWSPSSGRLGKKSVLPMCFIAQPHRCRIIESNGLRADEKGMVDLSSILTTGQYSRSKAFAKILGHLSLRVAIRGVCSLTKRAGQPEHR